MKDSSNYLRIGRDQCPEFYTLELDSDATPPKLILGINTGILQKIIGALSTMHQLKRYMMLLSKEGTGIYFLSDPEKPWGFGEVLHPYQRSSRDDEGSLVRYSISIPCVETVGGNCTWCRKGVSDSGQYCYRCVGTGKKIKKDSTEIKRILATLCVLGFMLEYPKKDWVSGLGRGREQFFSLKMSIGANCLSICADLSQTFSNYLRSLVDQELPAIKVAMQKVYLQMLPSHTRFSEYSFRAAICEKGRLVLDVPGNACGLYVDGMDRGIADPSVPMSLDCHNVDGYHQMLTLLCGLAAVCGMARKSLYPESL